MFALELIPRLIDTTFCDDDAASPSRLERAANALEESRSEIVSWARKEFTRELALKPESLLRAIEDQIVRHRWGPAFSVRRAPRRLIAETPLCRQHV